MFTDLINILQPYSIGIAFILLYLAEHILPERKELMEIGHDIRNILRGIFNFGLAFIAGYYFQKVLAYANKNEIGLFFQFTINRYILIGIQFLFIDLFMYWWHRMNHRIPAFWYFHKFHHTDTRMNTTTAFRFHAGELILSYPIKMAVFCLLGISVLSVMLYSLLFVPVVIFHHSDISISQRRDDFFRQFFVTPRMHRIHHSKLKYETDSNYSSFFPWWDLFFKTNRKKAIKEKIDFGL